MKVSFDTLRDEAMEGFKSDPFILEMPEGEPVEIHAMPSQVFMSEFNLNDGKLTIEAALNFVRSVFTSEQWDRVGPLLAEQPIPVSMSLLDKLIDHFNLSFDSSATAGKSEGSEQ